MAFLGKLISRSINLRNSLSKKNAAPEVYQRKTLRRLLEKAQYTAFGKHYGFEQILLEPNNFESAYQNSVPIFDYSKMHREWWHRLLDGEENISWPGKVKYFALSSGTSEAASKHLPVTGDMLKSIKKVALKQFYSISNFDVPHQMFTKGVLMLGGTTSLQQTEDYYEGDMSGISAKNIPRVLSNLYYKPGQKISKCTNWEERIEMMVEQAPNWDVGTLCGVPSWAQIVIERIIERYGLKNIHEIWPNFEVYIHGGVSFEPYRDYFNKMLGKPITYIETYMASEGSFGFKARPDSKGIKLILNTGIFYEFIPFNDENFDDAGQLIGTPKTKLVHEVEERVPYAVILSTCSGAWRYMIGDVVEFVDTIQNEIIIVGRTKQFLSICGEHTSVDNLDSALEAALKKYDLKISEYSVAGYRNGAHFAHHWYIGTDREDITAEDILNVVDQKLHELNDDYAVERVSALKEINVTILKPIIFENYMRAQGKYGAMNKFPRVLKSNILETWWQYLKAENIQPVSSTTETLYHN